MSGKIFIAAKDAFLSGDPYQHTYIVYDGDGNALTTGDQRIIRSGADFIGQPVIIEADRMNALPADTPHPTLSARWTEDKDIGYDCQKE